MNTLSLLWDPFFEFNFMRTSLVAIFALALGCAPVGLFLVMRRMSLIGDALSHAILPGVALGFIAFGLSLTAMSIGGLISALIVLLGAGLVTRVTELKEDANLTVFYLVSLAIGVILVSKFGTQIDLMDILFGSMLAVSNHDLVFLASVSTCSLLLLALFFRPLVMDGFDRDYFKTQGRHGGWVHFILLFLVALNLVAGFQTMGTLMSVGLMMLPTLTLRLWTKSMTILFWMGMVLALIAGGCGLLFSFYMDIPPGPAIIVFLGSAFFFSFLFGKQGGVVWRWIQLSHYQK